MPDPIVAAIYGPSDSGKSSAIAHALFDATYFCETRALASTEPVWGYSTAKTGRHLPLVSLVDATKRIRDLKPKRIVLDDLGLVVNKRVREEMAKRKENASGGFDPRKVYGDVQNETSDLLDACREVADITVLNCGQVEPNNEMSKGAIVKVHKGRPAVGSEAYAMWLMHNCDLMVRTFPATMPVGLYSIHPWSMTSQDTSPYLTRDRWHMFRGHPVYVNLAEVFRLRGHKIPRVNGEDKFEPIVDAAVKAAMPFQSGTNQAHNAITEVVSQIKSLPGVTKITLYRLIWDASARHQLLQLQQGELSERLIRLGIVT